MTKAVVEDISQYGEVLLGRERGAEVARSIESRMASLAKGDILALGLDGVDGIDYPAADELLKRIIGLVMTGVLKPDNYLIWLGGPENVLETLTAVCRDRSVVGFHFKDIDSLNDGHHRFLGSLPNHLEVTLDELRKSGPTTADELAKRLGIETSACHNRLVELRRRRLVVRQVVSSKGKYLYRFYGRQNAKST